MGKNRSTGDGLPGATFDPAKVPAYPVLTLTGADDPDNVTVDGEPFTGEDAFDRALAVCAARAGELGGAVRVRGFDRDGVGWPMVVTSTGELHDLSEHPDSPNKPKRAPLGRRTLLVGAIGGGAVLLAGGTTAGVFAYRALSAPDENPPPPLYPGQGANLPVPPPEGVATVAQWAVTIDPDATPVLLSDQRIVLTTPDGTLAIVDGLTGQLQWTGAATETLSRVGELRIGETPVLASYADDEALLWPLDDPSTPAPQTLTVEAGRAETVIISASAPLWILEAQTVSYLAGDRLALVDVPVPAVPAGVHTGDAVAVSADSWVSITADNSSSEHPLEGAPGTGAPLQARVLGADHLVALWDAEDTATLTLHELPDGGLIGQLDQLKSLTQNDTAEPRMSPDGTTWVWNNVLIRPAADTPLVVLSDFTVPGEEDDSTVPLEVSSISDTTLWGSVARLPTRYETATATATFYDEDATIPLGEARDGSLVYIVASRLEETSLYALPAAPPAPAPSDGGTS